METLFFKYCVGDNKILNGFYYDRDLGQWKWEINGIKWEFSCQKNEGLSLLELDFQKMLSSHLKVRKSKDISLHVPLPILLIKALD